MINFKILGLKIDFKRSLAKIFAKYIFDKDNYY